MTDKPSPQCHNALTVTDVCYKTLHSSPWQPPVTAAYPSSCTMPAASDCYRPFILHHGSCQWLLQTLHLAPWQLPVIAADPSSCTMAAASACCRPIILHRGSYQWLLQTLHLAPWQLPVIAADPSSCTMAAASDCCRPFILVYDSHQWLLVGPSPWSMAVACVHSIMLVFHLLSVLSVLSVPLLHAKYLKECVHFTGVEMNVENYAHTPDQQKIYNSWAVSVTNIITNKWILLY
jgi:DNA-directed RNA polymerase subunit H (RpoH/RPB5)